MQQVLAPKSIFRPGNLTDVKEEEGAECHRELNGQNRDDQGQGQITVRGAAPFPGEGQQQNESERDKQHPKVYRLIKCEME